MSRHRGVRNRQFSYDEGEEDYYDDEEEAAAAACEDHRRSVLQARGEAGGSESRSGGGSGGGVSLSSYFDLPDAAHQLNKQKPQQQQSVYGREDHTQGGTLYSGNADSIEATDTDEGDAELVAAIADELGRRLGKGRFSSRQVRLAVIESGYEVDTAEVILTTMTTEQTPQNAAAWATSSTTTGDPARAGLAPPGHNIDPSCPPSALAFGLCVDGRGDWRQVGTAGTAAPPGFGNFCGSGDGAIEGVESFGFDTPSPDDLNLYKQSGAGRKAGTMDIGGGMSDKGNGMRGTAAGGGAERTGTPQTRGGSVGAGGRGSGRKASVTSFSSPKANVVHIGTGSIPTSVTRKSIVSPTAVLRSSAQTTPTRGVGSQDQSPTGAPLPTTSPGMEGEGGGGGGGGGAKVMSSLQAAGGANESDEGEAGGKDRLTMVVIGHVDAGKSTLMGQVLVQLGKVTRRTLHKHEKEAREAGKASFFLAWVMDEDQDERAHGVTIDVAQKYIETEHKLVTLLDAPGHRDFIPKMIGGATAADAAVLVIAGGVGEFESGFQANGQTKEHAMLAKALGVNQLLVVVNKLDATDPPWSKERYRAVKDVVGPFLTRTGFKPKKVRFVPASGLSAENVSKRDPNGLLSQWYDGPTVLEAIDAFGSAPRATDKPFRMCVADVMATGKGVTVSGRVVQGRLRAGDKVVIMPLEDPATVVRLERNGSPARGARAGDNAEVALSGVDASRVVVGNVVCKAGGSHAAVVRRFNAQIVALPELEVPVIKGSEFQLHMHNLDVMAHCSRLVALTNSAGEVLKARPRCVPSGATAHIRITSSRPICLEKYGDCRALGRFVLRQKGATVAVGLVLETET